MSHWGQSSAIVCGGKCIGEMVSVCHHYDTSCGMNQVSSAHLTVNLTKDLKIVVHELLSMSKVFEHTPNCSHASLQLKGMYF